MNFAPLPIEGFGSLCVHCGYDLRGIPEGWKCPECAGTLRYADAVATH